ncbi:unnamed protein product [Pleuronectes platessa]|uniref:Uncharacterized protein n=1 Tax=Pleuronectes platessa TaxID=8262 RepID=A0A9N7UIQ8_PLEPL|nr:unnamed protein product [Pleuronectes platessa]
MVTGGSIVEETRDQTLMTHSDVPLTAELGADGHVSLCYSLKDTQTSWRRCSHEIYRTPGDNCRSQSHRFILIECKCCDFHINSADVSEDGGGRGRGEGGRGREGGREGA